MQSHTDYAIVILTLLVAFSFCAYKLFMHLTSWETEIVRAGNRGDATDDVLHSRLCDLYIKTSHNTYIQGSQNFSITTLDTFVKVLERGYKGIELDIAEFNGDIYVVHSGAVAGVDVYTTTRMPVDPYFEAIASYMGNTKTTLLLFLEVRVTSEALRSKLADIILKHLKSKLLVNAMFATKKLIDLEDQIIIITTSPNLRQLEECVTQHLYSSPEVISVDSNYDKPNTPNILSRIYPAERASHALSYNYNADLFFKGRNNCVSMNANKFDKALYDYESFFGGYSFKKIQSPE